MNEDREQPQNMVAAGAQVATSFFDSMKQQPVLLGLLVLNALVFAFLFYSIGDLASKRSAQMTQILERCLPQLGGNGPH